MAMEHFDLPARANQRLHLDRVSLIRLIDYQSLTSIGEEENIAVDEVAYPKNGQCTLVNISSGGMLVMMDGAPSVYTVFRLGVPTPAAAASTPTLAEVRWVSQAPVVGQSTLHLVGLRFLL